jgi:protein-arginine deiminase
VTSRKLRGPWLTAGFIVLCFAVVSCGGGGSGGKHVSSDQPRVPTADFTVASNVVALGQQVQFFDRSHGVPTSWEWDFTGDGIIDSTEKDPIFEYTTQGYFSVTLTVTNDLGTGSITKQNYIDVAAGASPVADLNVDANRDGFATNLPSDQDYKNQWSTTHGAVFYHNIDDDNQSNQEDFRDAVKGVEDAKDLAPVIVRRLVDPPAGGTAAITLNAPARGKVRIFRDNGGTWTPVYQGSAASFDLPLDDVRVESIQLGVEGRERLSANWDGFLRLTLEIKEPGGAIHSSDEVLLRQAPPLFATNLWDVRELHVVNVTTSPAPHGNAALLASLTSICNDAGIQLRQVPGTQYQNDRWLQDSSEPGVTLLPSTTGPRRVNDYVYQAYRLRPVDMWCRNALLGPNWDFQERFGAVNSSLNYGGNIEVIPPHSGRPWGRMLIGGGNGNLIGTSTPATEYMDNANRAFFDANPLQGPHVEATTEWLAVGHIDEYTMFVPAPNTARGYVCLIASPIRAWNQLVALNQAGQGNLKIFEGRTTYGWETTVSAVVGNSTMANYQQLVQARIDQGRDQIKSATGLTDADFIELPVLFENVGGNYQAAFNPGVVNLLCMPSPNGTVYFAVPDPEGPKPGGTDIWRQDVISQLNTLTNGSTPFDIRFVDVFYSYHDLLGEVHCGTNTARIPPDMDWWDK